MRILHLSSDYAKQKIYFNLIRHLALKGLNQMVYVPVRTKSEMGINIDISISNIEYKFSHVLNFYHKINYFKKIDVTFSDLEKEFDLRQVDLIHAHFLFSDGGMALEAKKKYGLKYIVAVRNTDINYFYKYGFHLRGRGNQILENAESVIFISPGHRKKLLQNYLSAGQAARFNAKTHIIPNGVDEFWINNRFFRTSMPNESLGIIYVGEYSKNKNLETLIEAVKLLIQFFRLNVTLTLIGEYGDNVKKIASISSGLPWIKSYSRMDKEEILNQLRSNHIFAMPSFKETFGLVYIEALSQGLPILYTQGEGVDGYFDEGEVGYGINPKSAKDIASRVMNILKTDYVSMSNRCTKISDKFTWNLISDEYLNLYKKASNK